MSPTPSTPKEIAKLITPMVYSRVDSITKAFALAQLDPKAFIASSILTQDSWHTAQTIEDSNESRYQTSYDTSLPGDKNKKLITKINLYQALLLEAGYSHSKNYEEKANNAIQKFMLMSRYSNPAQIKSSLTKPFELLGELQHPSSLIYSLIAPKNYNSKVVSEDNLYSFFNTLHDNALLAKLDLGWIALRLIDQSHAKTLDFLVSNYEHTQLTSCSLTLGSYMDYLVKENYCKTEAILPILNKFSLQTSVAMPTEKKGARKTTRAKLKI